MSVSPVWDYEKSPKIEVTKSQLDRLAQDETYFTSFIEWMNETLKDNTVTGDTTSTTTGKIIPLDSTIHNLQPRPDNVVSRLVGESFYDRMTQLFSTQESNFIVQVNDEETIKKVEWLRENVIPILSNLLNGNLERYSTVKRLQEADKEVDKAFPIDHERGNRREENRAVKDVLKLIERYDVEAKDVSSEEWSKRYDAITDYKHPKKVAALIRDFDVRLFRRMRMHEITTAIEDDTAGRRYAVIKELIDNLMKEKVFAEDKFKSSKFMDKETAIFACDVKYRFFLSCADNDDYYDIQKLLQRISDLLKNNNVSQKDIKKDLLSTLLKKLKKFADDKTIVYENLLDLFESSKDREFAKTLKEDYIPKIQDLFTYSSFLVSNWQSFVEMIHAIRSRLESINPSDSRLGFDIGSDSYKDLQTLQGLQTLQNEENRNNELEKRCSFNRLASIFSDIDNTIGATSVGGPLPDRLRGVYFRLWGSLQQVVKNDEVDGRIYCTKTYDALNDLVKDIQSATGGMLHSPDAATKLQELNQIWDKVSSAINRYLQVLKADHQTLPVLLDNQVFQIDKANLLLPRPSADIRDNISRMTFKIYYMQIFFNSLFESATNLRKYLQAGKSPKPKSVAKRDTQRLIDEIQYRERFISGEFNTNESYAAAFQIICDTVLRHATWYFCVGLVDNTTERYNIDFRIYDPHGTSDKIEEIQRMPDLGNYVLYMKQFIDENNRTRKTTAFKVDFFQMVYTQFLSAFHLIETGLPGADGSVDFLTSLYHIALPVEKAAKALINDTGRAEAFKYVRSSSAYRQLLKHYSYDELVQSGSIEALAETDFLLLMDNARDFYNIVQIFYNSIFAKTGSRFQNTTKSSLYDNLIVSNLVSLVKSVTPDWHTDDMCEGLVRKMLLDTSDKTEKRDFIGDAKRFIKKIRRAGGARNGPMAKKYVSEAMEKIAKWIDGGGHLDAQYLEHFRLISAKVRQDETGLLNATLGHDAQGILGELRDDIVAKVKSRLGSVPSPGDYLSVVSDILEEHYDVEADVVKKRIEIYRLDVDDKAVKDIYVFKAVQLV